MKYHMLECVLSTSNWYYIFYTQMELKSKYLIKLKCLVIYYQYWWFMLVELGIMLRSDWQKTADRSDGAHRPIMI